MSKSACCCGCGGNAEEHQLIVCGVCSKSFIHSCVDLTLCELRTIKTKNKCLSWSCRECSSLGNSINALKAAILDLKKEIQTHDIKALNDSVFEDLLHELSDRYDRKQNIIVFKHAEIESQNITERDEHDISTAKSILGSLSAGIDLTRIEVHRLGRYVKNKPRPLKIKLGNSKDVHAIIKNAKNLKDSATYNHISISYDRTTRQINYYKKIKAELDARVAAGEQNLKIRYKSGVPIIDTLN